MWFDILKTNQYMVKNSIWNDAFGHYNAGAFSINELEYDNDMPLIVIKL